jgi:beta-lactamase regulating signal transducer with metallopeptidase domain
MTPGSLLLRVSFLLALVAAVQMLLARRTSAAARHLVWVLTLAGVLLLPLASSILPAWTVVRFAGAEPAPTAFEADQLPSEPVTAVANQASSNASLVVNAEARPSSRAFVPAWPNAVAAVYATGVVFLLGRWTAQRLSLERMARHSTPVADTQWRRLIDECADRMGVPRTIRVRRSRELTVPLAFGFLRGTILLPCVADTWLEERRRAVLLHELGHVARFDCVTQMTATMACALYWIHPGIWWAARRLRVEQELACDDLVLSAGTDARDYAGHLLKLAYVLRGHAPSVAVGMAGSQRLEGRLVALLDATRNRAMPSTLQRIAGGLAMAAVIAPIAAATTGAAQPASSVQVSPTLSQDQTAESRWIANTVDSRTLRLKLLGRGRSATLTLDVRQLADLAPAQLTNTTHVKFVLKREAGSFSFEGAFLAGVGTGTYTFTPSADFLAELARRKLEKPSDSDLQALAVADVGVSYFEALGAEGYPGATAAQIVRGLDHGVNLNYVREMGQEGYRLDGLEALVVLRDHGVSAQYARELRELELTALPPADLVRSRDHGVSPDYVRGLRGLGYPQLSLDELIRARDHGVSVDYAIGMRDFGFSGLSLETLARARDHGVSLEYVSELRVLGYRFTLDELAKARDHGVSFDYIQELRARGYEKLTLDDLVRLRDHGVSTEYLEKVSALGIAHPSIDDLVAMRDRGFPEQAGQQLYRALASHLGQISWHLRCASAWLEQALSGASTTSAC